MPEIPPLGEMSRSDKRGAVSARRKLSRSGATRLKRLEVVLRTNPGAVVRIQGWQGDEIFLRLRCYWQNSWTAKGSLFEGAVSEAD